MQSIKRSLRKRGIFKTTIFIIGSSLYYFVRIFYDIFLKYVKVKNDYILFYSIPDYSDNAKFLFEYLIKGSYQSRKYIWLVNDNSNNKIKNVKFINFSSNLHTGPTLKSLYYSSVSKYVFYTHVSPLNRIAPKRNQLIINLWHGCGYKNDIKDNKTYIEKNYFDYVLVPGKVFVETKTKFFGCKKEQVLALGYPRYDLLLKNNDNTKAFINRIKNNNKLVVWMPTFRKTIDELFPENNNLVKYDIPLLESNDDFLELNDFCKKNGIILCIKRHPLQVRYLAESLCFSNIIFLDNNYFIENNIELYSFLKYTDALVTDYSSIAIDYLLLNKPIGFVLSDFEEYLNSRGFVFEEPLRYMPGYHIYNKKELEKMLIDISKDVDRYVDERKSILKDVHNICDNYCERIKNVIFNLK